MPSAKKKRGKPQPKPIQRSTSKKPTGKLPVRPLIKEPANQLRYSLIITGIFFLLAFLGIWNHEMWRDEHQAWLVARDAHSISQLFQNMRYEGNPALWHFFLYLISSFTHNPVYMQAFHLLIACGFIFVFNRYAPIGVFFKILFSFGYFAAYEYAIISRSYGLGLLLVFIVCAIYRNRTSNYVWLGVILAFLANVAIYPLVIAVGLAGILVLDYIYFQNHDKKFTLKLVAGLAILLVGVVFSLYQIWPDKNNSFPAPFATKIFDFPRWSSVAARLFTTYLYIPGIQENFWNTNIYFTDPTTFEGLTFGQWLDQYPVFLWTWVYLPWLLFISGMMIFLRKPLIFLLYVGTTFGLLLVYYYTGLKHMRYCGHLLIALVVCYWLAEYYQDFRYQNGFLRGLSSFGRKISKPFLAVVLIFNLIGAAVAYSMDFQFKFSTSKDASEYIRQNKLDTLTMAGITDFTISPIASYLDCRIFYPQMNAFGSFTIWNNKRVNQLTLSVLGHSLDSLMKDKNKLCLILDNTPTISRDGVNKTPLEHGIIAKNLQVDLLQRFDAGIVPDEKYYIYLIQRVDPARVDPTKYPVIN